MAEVRHLPTAQLAPGEDHHGEGRDVRPMFAEDVEEKVQARLRSRAKRLETMLDVLAMCVASYGLRDQPMFTRFISMKLRKFDREIYGEELLVIERWLGTLKEKW